MTIHPLPPSHSIEFVAPFAVDTCRQRLEHRHEPMSLFAFNYQYRLSVKVKRKSADRCEFSLRYVRKSAPDILNTYGVKGMLQPVDATHTLVTADSQISYGMILAPLLFMGLLMAVLLGFGNPRLNGPQLVPVAVGYFIIAIFTFLYTVWWANSKMGDLSAVVRESLGDLGTPSF